MSGASHWLCKKTLERFISQSPPGFRHTRFKARTASPGYEVHGPFTYHCKGSACCCWDAKTKAIQEVLSRPKTSRLLTGEPK